MMKFFMKNKGAISVFLVIIMLPMMTVASIFVDLSKLKLAEGVAESAGDLALNTALTNYDTQLKELYGLFATAQDMSTLFKDIEGYFKRCVTSAGVDEKYANELSSMIMSNLGTLQEVEPDDILNIEISDFSAKKVTDATLTNAAVLERQIVDFMKYRAPINTGLSFLSSLQSFSTLSKQTELVEKRQNYYKEQESVMRSAQLAWELIHLYDQTDVGKNDTYLSDKQGSFSGFAESYYNASLRTIRDLYDTQNYDRFAPRLYSIVDTEVEIEGEKKVIPYFYTKYDKSTKLTPYNEYTTFSKDNLASRTQLRNALIDLNNSINKYHQMAAKLIEFDDQSYELQLLVQINRINIYNKWNDAMVEVYKDYSYLRHLATYSGKLDNGSSIFSYSEDLFGNGVVKTYDNYYDDLTTKFDSLSALYLQQLSRYNKKLDPIDDKINTDTLGVNVTMSNIFDIATGFQKSLTDAKAYLDGAISHLQDVYDKIKPGGTLEQKQRDWKTTASSSDLSKTSMAKQDLAEIKDLSSYFVPKDVEDLIARLKNISTGIGKIIDQIDTYTFYDTRITEIYDFTSFCSVLAYNIGDATLKSVPINTTQLNAKAESWSANKFHIGQEIDVSWKDQPASNPILKNENGCDLNFYNFMDSHFGYEGVFDQPEENPKEDKENGEDLYDSIKEQSSSQASSVANKENEGGSSKELNAIANRPSANVGTDAETPSAPVSTGDTALSDTSSGLSSMFSNLAKAALNFGTDLRDKLYVADYVLSMFSYDTVEKELQKKKGDDATPQTLTLTPIDAQHNFAYGREVEYIIYGGTNTSNVVKAYGSIYGIRFGFNLIYAFMDSEIRDTAFAMATPISAATLGIVPIPLIQAVIIIGIAACESALDLDNIRNGESVPLFKTKKTWTCSVSGLVKVAKDKAGEIIKTGVNYVIDEGTREIAKVLDMTNEELDKYIDSGADDLMKYVGDSYDTLIARHANTAIQKLTTLATNAIEEHALDPATDMVTYVSTGLDKWLAEEAAASGGSDIGYTVKNEAVNIIKSSFISTVLEELQKAGDAATGAIEDVANSISDTIADLRDQILQKINNSCDAVKNYKSEMLDSLKDSMNNGAQSLKDTLNSQIDGIFGSGSGGSANSTDNTGLSSLISFSYSDYLRLFLMIGLYTNEEGILLRTADAIQANMVIASQNDKYKLADSAAYVQVSCNVKVKPLMIALPLFADIEGNPKDNANWYTFEYNEIKGY